MDKSSVEIWLRNHTGLGSSCPKIDGKKLKLLQVHTAFRHGARTPMIDQAASALDS